MTDLEKSEIVIAKILTLLIEWGIQETQLAFKELELDQSFAPFFWPCIQWLKDEGIIRTGQLARTMGSAGGTVINPVLTSRGMSVLGHKLKIGDEERPLADQVRKVSEAGTNYSGLGDFFGGFLGGFTKSINS